MKKAFFLLSITLLSGVILFSQSTATISLPHLGSLPAGDVFMPITIEDISPGDNFGTFQLAITYDPAVLTPVEVVFTNPGLPFYEWSISLNYLPNQILLTWLSFSGGYTPTPVEELCQVKWQYTGYPDYSDFIWDDTSSIENTLGEQYILTLNDGSIGPDGQNSATLTIPHLGGLPAGDIFMPITVHDIFGEDDFGSFQFRITYDPDVLTPAEVIFTNPNLPFYEWTISLVYLPNQILLTWLSFSGGYTPSSGEELCQVKWQFTGNPDYSDLIWDEATYVETSSGIPYTLALNHGSVGTLEASLSVPDLGPGIPVGSVHFPIIVDSIYGGVDSLQFYLSFDPGVLTPEDVLYPNPDFISSEWSNNLSSGPDEIELTWKNAVPAGQINVYPDPGDTLCVLQFYYSGSPDYSPLTWGTSDLIKGTSSMWNYAGNIFTLNLIDGSCGVPYQPTTTLSLPHLGSLPAGDIYTPITVDNISPGDDFGTFMLRISYDPAVLTPVEVILTNPNLPFYEWQNSLTFSPNMINLSWLSFTGGYTPTPVEELCQVKWQYTGNPDYSDLIWEEETNVWTSSGTEYLLALIDGSVGSLSYQPEATISVPHLGGLPAGSVFFPVTIEDLTPGESMDSLLFYFTYDPNVLTPVDVSYSDPNFPFYDWINNLAYGPDEIILTWTSSTIPKYPDIGDVFCTIEFNYIGYPGYSDLTWDLSDGGNNKDVKGEATIWNGNADPYILTLIDGSCGLSEPLEATLSVTDLGGGITAGPVEFPIVVNEINNGIYTLQFYLSYIPTVLTPTDVIYTNPAFESSEWINDLNYGTDEIELAWMNQFPNGLDNEYPQPGDTLCIIEFYYEGDPLNSYLDWNTTDEVLTPIVKGVTGVWDNLGNPFILTLINGSCGPGPLYVELNIPDLGGGIPAGIVTTPLTVEDIAGGDDFGTFQIFIQYDNTVLTPLNVNYTNPNLPFYEWQNSLNYHPIRSLVTWLSFSGGYTPSPGEELCTIDWDYTGDPDFSDLTFTTLLDFNTFVWTSSGNEYSLELNHGSVGPFCCPLVADFSADPAFGIAPLDVQFTDLSEGTILNWQWDFDNDGVIDSYDQNPQWTYQNAGVYSVKLVIEDGVLTDTLIIEDYITVTEENYFELKVFLEGPFLNGQMVQYLNIFGYIPLSQPYNSFPWYYEGDESLDAMPNFDVVDWILIELRETTGTVLTATEETIIGRKAGLLLNDGSIVDLDGSSPIMIEGQIENNLYIVLYHRNHFGIISSMPVYLSKGNYTYDFTLSPYQTYGGELSVKDLGNDIWGVPGGNGLFDSKVDNKDKNDLWAIQNGLVGYFNGDYNMDGTVSPNDKIEIWSESVGRSEVMPDGTNQGIWVCGDPIEDSRDDQFYSTVQVGSQCWMAENINIGVNINGSMNQSDNGVFEKYCYENDIAYCDMFGGLYQWDEMMQYVTQEGTTGICPDAWHIPSDDEWKTLEGFADSLYAVGDPEWEQTGLRGYDVGKNLKSVSDWINNGGGVDLYNFTTLPAGQRNNSALFISLGLYGYFWTSSSIDQSNSWRRYFITNFDFSGRDVYSKGYGFSVRCIRD